MEQNLFDRMLDAYQRDKTQVTFTLQNRVRIQGRIKAFDSYVIMMDSPKHDIIYRHAVSCIAPAAQESRQHAAAQAAALESIKEDKQPQAVPQKQNSPDRNRPAHPSEQHKIGQANGDVSINSAMKEGLLKWMQVQKASK